MGPERLTDALRRVLGALKLQGVRAPRDGLSPDLRRDPGPPPPPPPMALDRPPCPRAETVGARAELNQQLSRGALTPASGRPAFSLPGVQPAHGTLPPDTQPRSRDSRLPLLGHACCREDEAASAPWSPADRMLPSLRGPALPPRPGPGHSGGQARAQVSQLGLCAPCPGAFRSSTSPPEWPVRSPQDPRGPPTSVPRLALRPGTPSAEPWEGKGPRPPRRSASSPRSELSRHLCNKATSLSARHLGSACASP